MVEEEGGVENLRAARRKFVKLTEISATSLAMAYSAVMRLLDGSNLLLVAPTVTATTTTTTIVDK